MHLSPASQTGAPPCKTHIPPCATTQTAPGDLTIEIREQEIVVLYGTRAMLEAEGVITPGTVWPQGYDDLHWQSGVFDYSLHRLRPSGAKGPRKQFAECDWFPPCWALSNPAIKCRD